MQFLRTLIVAGFLLSTTLAAPLLPVKVHDLSARVFDIEPKHVSRSLSEEAAVVARNLSEDLEVLIPREEQYADSLVARNKYADTLEKLKAGLKTGPGQAVFWSGSTPRLSNKKKPMVQSAGIAAGDFARKNGKLTIKMMLSKQGIQTPKANPNDPDSAEWWRVASEEFAKGASGEVHVFLGQNVNQNGVYIQVEKKILMDSPSVTKLIEHVANQDQKKPDVINYIKGSP